MTTNTSSTTVATRLNAAIQETEKRINPDRVVKLREFKSRVDKLQERGLINREEYSNFTTAQFQKWARNS